MGEIKIKQPPMYFDYASPDWVERYDHTLVYCECGNLMEKGIGLCDKCIEDMLYEDEEKEEDK